MQQEFPKQRISFLWVSQELEVFFALQTGMRRGEILGLCWKDVNFTTNLIEVRHSKAGRPRHVPMSSELFTMLKSMPSKSNYVFGVDIIS